MKFKIYATGKIKDFYKAGCDEYIKRLSSYCKIETIELKDEPISEHPSEAEINKAKQIEGERVLKNYWSSKGRIKACSVFDTLSSILVGRILIFMGPRAS